MRIAIVGTGISGLVVAHLLQHEHEIVVYEAQDWIGGHTHTVDVEVEGERFAVDTGFIVYNPERYPGLVRLLEQLRVRTRATSMSFSVRSDPSGLEFGTRSLRALLCQKRNLLRPGFWRMLRDIGRFRAKSLELIANGDERTTLGDYLAEQRFSPEFRAEFLVPMGAAIWSTDPARMLAFPAVTFARFFHNHRFLEPGARKPWRTIVGGSRVYVEALVAPFRERIRLRAKVQSIHRSASQVELRVAGAPRPERFDRVVVATHSDQALQLLQDPSEEERSVLGAIRYQPNEVVLHTDERLLPRRRAAWSSWNAHLPREPGARALVSYNMNILQGLRSRRPLLVTLNEGASIDPRQVLGRWLYEHPELTAGALAAQRRKERLDGQRGTFFCGAYWGYGFHEDGVQSALSVARHFGRTL